MKKLCVLLAALMVLGAGMVTTGFAAITVEGDVYAGVFDKYLWRGFDLSDSKPVAQGGIDLSAGNFTLSTWHNFQLTSGDAINAGEITETDIILDYSFDVGEMLSISVGNIWYMLDFGTTEEGDTAGQDELDEDTNELYLSATINTVLSPTFTMYYDWDGCEEEGLFYTADISHSLDLMEGLSMSLGALVSYNQHSDFAVGDFGGWHNYQLSVGFDYALTDQLTVSPSFAYSSGISSAAKDAIDSEMVSGINLAFTF